MKSINRSIYWQWFAIGVFITLVCLGFAVYMIHFLTERERVAEQDLRKFRHSQIVGPIRNRLETLQALVATGKFSIDEAFEIIDRTKNAPFPEASYLLDGKKKIIAAHVSNTFDKNNLREFREYQLGPDRFWRFYLDHKAPPFRGGRKGPPPGTLIFIGIVLCLSIVVGIGLSLFTLTFYMRKRAKSIEAVMNRIKSGDLKARLVVNQMDEAGLLMTKFNDMAREIETLVTNLRETEESRKVLLQELAHDLRTPVASLKNIQETLFENGELLDPERRKQLQTLAMKEVSYFERLVEDLLFLSGVIDPRYGQMTTLPLTSIVREELDVFTLENIDIGIHSEGDVWIKSDEKLLRRLLKNAISNASRYAKSKVEVTIGESHGAVVLVIQDDGPGLKDSELVHYGEKKFSRKYEDLTKGHLSIGLGSVIMKKIMTLHNGSLEIINCNPGAKLILKFPL